MKVSSHRSLARDLSGLYLEVSFRKVSVSMVYAKVVVWIWCGVDKKIMIFG